MDGLVADSNTHVAGGALDNAHGRLDVTAVEVREFSLGDLFELGATDAAR